LNFNDVIALYTGWRQDQNPLFTITPIIDANYTLRLMGEGFQTFTVKATSLPWQPSYLFSRPLKIKWSRWGGFGQVGYVSHIKIHFPLMQSYFAESKPAKCHSAFISCSKLTIFINQKRFISNSRLLKAKNRWNSIIGIKCMFPKRAIPIISV
jgi:hypothetical protein